MILEHDDFNQNGIFGTLTTRDSKKIFCTLEHAYSGFAPGEPPFVPKLLPGEYQCVRGMHQLEGMAEPFETFEITNVPGHTDILFHTGNFNKDSAGCVLLGLARNDTSILNSREAFDQFMEYLEGINEFTLTVIKKESV